MKDRKFQYKNLRNKYPPPGVPVDDAWAEMKRILDADSQVPGRSRGSSKIPGGQRLLLYAALLIVAISIILFKTYKKQTKTTLPGSSVTAGINSTKNVTHEKYDATNVLIKKSNTPDTGSHTILKNSVIHPASAADITSQRARNTKEATVTLLQANANNPSLKNKINKDINNNRKPVADAFLLHNNIKNISPGNAIASGINRNSNQVTGVSKGRKIDMEKNLQQKLYKEHANNWINSIAMEPGKAKTNSRKGINKKHISSNYQSLTDQQLSHLYADNISASGKKGEVSKMTISDTSLSTRIFRFATDSISTELQRNIHLNISYLQKSKNDVHNIVTSRKGLKSKNNIKDSGKRSTKGFNYGGQWDIPVPLSKTAYYFIGTNGKPAPYNLVIPRVWISKKLSTTSGIFLKIKVNEQFFVGHKEIAEHVNFITPRDTSLQKIFLSKISGMSAGFSYSYVAHKKWTAALGINYALNMKALLNKESVNFYSGSFLNDSLYGIKKASTDWQYIPKSIVSGNLELYYILKKISLGANFSYPLSKIPVYGNKNYHPLNAQLFLRWRVK